MGSPFSPPSATPPTLEALLDASAARADLKADVLAYAAYRQAARVATAGHPPRPTVVRLLCQLFASEPELAIEHIHVRGVSGCSDFRGEITVVVAGVERTWDFVWDCRWRARDAGLVDLLGYPDQARAAREYDWQCFAAWRERVAEAAVTR